MTAILFKDWVLNCAIPEIKHYCFTQNLSFKALILLDNAPSHPIYIQDTAPENIKFVFMPPNTTSLIQPMDQCVIYTFKSYYLRRTFKELMHSIDSSDKNTMTTFWKQFSIKDAIDHISNSWKEIKQSCMNGAWRKIWPECVPTREENETSFQSVIQTYEEITNLAKEFNFEGMETEDIDEIIFQKEDLSNEDLMSLDPEIMDQGDEEQSVEKKELTAKVLSKTFNLIDEALEILGENDPDYERSLKVARAVQNDISCYKEIYKDIKKKPVQKDIKSYFSPKV